MTAYTIRDPRPTAKANPFSFYYPCEERRAAISAGDHVQVIFEPVDAPRMMSERMWIEVESVEDTTVVGLLDNVPFQDLGLLRHGNRIRFDRDMVIDIRTDRQDDPEETNNLDPAYLERCMIDPRIMSATEGGALLPVRAERTAAKPLGFDKEFTSFFGWSGWLIVAEGWTPDIGLTVGTPVIAVRLDAGLAPMIKEPHGAVVEKVDGKWRRIA